MDYSGRCPLLLGNSYPHEHNGNHQFDDVASQWNHHNDAPKEGYRSEGESLVSDGDESTTCIIHHHHHQGHDSNWEMQFEIETKIVHHLSMLG